MNSARAIFLLVVVFIVFIGLVSNLFVIQVRDHERYVYLASRIQNETKTLKGERGYIYDRNGEVLVYNKSAVSYFVDVRMMDEKKKLKTAEKFSDVFGKSKEHYLKVMNAAKRIVALEKNAPKEKSLLMNDFVMDAMIAEDDPVRAYTYEELASHVIGFANKEGKGIDGVEKYYDEYLRGEDGELFLLRDVRGRTIAVSEERTVKPKKGKDIFLTIDRNFQEILEDELNNAIKNYQARSAIGIIMNPNNGEILALANSPDFNPNRYWKYSNYERRNKILTDTYEPGSTFKSIVMSILLDTDVVKEEDLVFAENGRYKFKRIFINDTHNNDWLTVSKVLSESSNIGMVKLAQKLDRQEFYKYLRDFGFGNFTSIDLPGEAGGLLKKPDRFGDYTQAFMSFGYEVAVTPIQLIAAYGALINGGALYQPHIVKKIATEKEIVEDDFVKPLRRVIDIETSRRIKKMMITAVEEGTGKEAGIESVKIGGKTGTSQQWVENKYSKEEYNSSFVGFFPYENPKAACLILIDAPQVGKYGGRVAAPVFKNVAQRMIKSDPTLIYDNIEEAKTLNENKFFAAHSNEEPRVEKISLTSLSNDRSAEITEGVMPNLNDYTIKEAMSVLSKLGVNYKVEGSGRISYQSVKPGVKLSGNELVTIRGESINLN